MPIRPILFYPDLLLRQTAQPVQTFDSSLQNLITDLVDTLHAIPAIGLTAPHLGILQRTFVLKLPDHPLKVYINPQIETFSEETARFTEGSVSMPGIMEEITRSAHVTLRFQDAEGKEHRESASNFHAACIQHEVDQLDGIFWLQRLSRLKRERAIKRYQSKS